MQTKKELLGLRIKEFRENRKLTQDKLSEMVGIDPKHLSRIENGRNYPSFETLEKILESLDISYEDIFNFNHYCYPPNIYHQSGRQPRPCLHLLLCRKTVCSLHLQVQMI